MRLPQLICIFLFLVFVACNPFGAKEQDSVPKDTTNPEKRIEPQKSGEQSDTIPKSSRQRKVKDTLKPNVALLNR